jgi:hypothetical protein
VVLGLGESVTCTITNNDYPGKLTIIKKTDPANDPTVFSFTLSVYPFTFTLTGASPGNQRTFTFDQQPPLTVTEVIYQTTGTSAGQWRLEDIRCTGGKEAVVVDLATGTVTINIVVGDDITCTFWNALPRMTGGGSVFTTADTATAAVPAGTRVSHGFTLRCGVAAKGPNNNLEINWSSVTSAKTNNKLTNAFHMNTLLSAVCDGNPTTADPDLQGLNPEMPWAPFNRYIGSGTGTLNNGKPNSYYARWVLVDNGQPGLNDWFTLTIWKVSDLGGVAPAGITTAITATPLISFGDFGVASGDFGVAGVASGNHGLKLDMGNHQAH